MRPPTETVAWDSVTGRPDHGSLLPCHTIALVPWGLLLALAVLASVVMVQVMRRRPRSPANLRLFFIIRVVLLVAVVVLFYLTFFHRPAA